jgi:hypothetical protein
MESDIIQVCRQGQGNGFIERDYQVSLGMKEAAVHVFRGCFAHFLIGSGKNIPIIERSLFL